MAFLMGFGRETFAEHILALLGERLPLLLGEGLLTEPSSRSAARSGDLRYQSNPLLGERLPLLLGEGLLTEPTLELSPARSGDLRYHSADR